MPILRPEERIGTTIAGKYRIDRILGKGGMGVVFVGLHLLTERPVAIKVLLPIHEGNPVLFKRFLREARTASALRHPNVVDVLDLGQTEDGSGFMILELLEGEPLSARLEREKTLAPHIALSLLLPIMDALSAAHAMGVIHRDLKPDNIFLSIDGKGRLVPKLLDFGVAKACMDESFSTQSGAIIGTPQYMSPEQASTVDPLPPASDVWSMGVVLYECLSGQLPFVGPGFPQLMVKILAGEYEPLWDKAPWITTAVADVVHRALSPELEERYPDMASLSEAMSVAARSSGISIQLPRMSRSSAAAWGEAATVPDGRLNPTPLATPSRSTAGASRRWWLLGALPAALVAAGVGWMLTRPPPPDEASDAAAPAAATHAAPQPDAGPPDAGPPPPDAGPPDAAPQPAAARPAARPRRSQPGEEHEISTIVSEPGW